MFGFDAEISRVVNGFLSSGEVVTKDAVVLEIMSRHPRPTGEDANYWLAAELVALGTTVRNCIQKRKIKEDKGEFVESETLPGYEYLQRSYSVDRDGEQAIVPLEALDIAEGMRKVRHLRSLAKSNLGHAEELEKYLHRRAN